MLANSCDHIKHWLNYVIVAVLDLSFHWEVSLNGFTLICSSVCQCSFSRKLFIRFFRFFAGCQGSIILANWWNCIFQGNFHLTIFGKGHKNSPKGGFILFFDKKNNSTWVQSGSLNMLKVQVMNKSTSLLIAEWSSVPILAVFCV